MRLDIAVDGVWIHHDIRGSFGELLRETLCGSKVAVAHGPIYTEDPAASIMEPFERSARESGWSFDELIIPDWALRKAARLRTQAVLHRTCDVREINEWTRAGLVLEIASRWGIPRVGGVRTHVRWRLNATVTNRFGVEPGSRFNPQTMNEDQRRSVAASIGYDIGIIDFNAFDLRSMASLVPDMMGWYEDATDWHQRTADIMDMTRDIAKGEVFLHAYGGMSSNAERFRTRMPYLEQIRAGEHGDGARRVQTQSARAFRAALSNALPLLTGEKIRPLFTVHDELVVEYTPDAGLASLMGAMDRGASQTIGVPYSTRLHTGRTYEEAKRNG